MRLIGMIRRLTSPSLQDVHATWVSRMAVRVQRTPPAARCLTIAALLIGVWQLVLITDGAGTALQHLFYLPVILAALGSGYRAAVATAVVAMLLAGPLLPGQEQSVLNWVGRGAAFVFVGLVCVLAVTARDALTRRDLDEDLRAMIVVSRRPRPLPAARPSVQEVLRTRAYWLLAHALQLPPHQVRALQIVHYRVMREELSRVLTTKDRRPPPVDDDAHPA